MQAETPDAPKSIPTNASPRTDAKYPHLFRLLHWVLPVAMVIGALSGLSLHAVARPGWSLFSGVLPPQLWGGRVHVLHFVAAVVTTASVVAALYLYWRRKTRRRAIHLILLGSGALMALSGLLMIHTVGPTWVYWIARLLHAVTGLGVLPLALAWHLTEGLIRYPRFLVAVFHPWASPQWKQLLAFVPPLLAAACLIFNVLPRSLVDRQLVAKRIASTDQSFEGLPWNEAQPLRIELADGAAFDKGRTRVTLQALHDGEDLFLRAQWLDPTQDRQYQPWKKSQRGWQHLVTELDDEAHYYEDKFSLIFPTKPNRRFDVFGCALCCHVGGGRAYGYKGFDSTIDVWHWKATRTDPVGQIDDKYWSQVELGVTNGRHGDPSSGGGYKKNVSQDASHPAYLPATPWAVRQGGILADQAVPYGSHEADKIADQMPPGTIVPGIVFSPFEGDRGDVVCQSSHEDGRWEVRIRRKLDTGSEYDVRFVPGRAHSFACAAFDRASKRHAYGFSVFELTLER